MADNAVAHNPTLSPQRPPSAMRRPHRSSSQSPTRSRLQLHDELLSYLSPKSAVDALQAPVGALKACLDHASASEQSFAMRTAVASKKIQDWLEELSDWPWPANGRSAGFEMPSPKRRKLSDPFATHQTAQDDDEAREPLDYSETDYLGSLPVRQVAEYERRLQEIERDMDALDVEEIKSQVLHNHMMPASRASSPFIDAPRSAASAPAYNRLDDLTAVVTAITIQALPYLLKLTSLLSVWSTRLLVLRQVPNLLQMLADAEIAMRSGWGAIRKGASSPPRDSGEDKKQRHSQPAFLSREDFNTMRAVLQGTVDGPQRALDAMLDALEVSEDTLPDEWIDRLEAIEKDYDEWTLTGTRQIEQRERVQKQGGVTTPTIHYGGQLPGPRIQVQSASPIAQRDGETGEFADSLSPTPLKNTTADDPIAPLASDSDYASPNDLRGRKSREDMSRGPRILVDFPADHVHDSAMQVPDLGRLDYDGVEDERLTGDPLQSQEALTLGRSVRGYDGSGEGESPTALDDTSTAVVGPCMGLQPSPMTRRLAQEAMDQDSDFHLLESVDEEEETGSSSLRFPTRTKRRDSDDSTFFEEDPDKYLDGTLAGGGSPPHLPDRDEPFPSCPGGRRSLSPPRYMRRNRSDGDTEISFRHPRRPARPTHDDNDMSDTDVSSYQNTSHFRSPSVMSTTSEMSMTGEDFQMHHQINQVLGKLPNKIHLSKKSQNVNLNPPDFQPPKRPRVPETARRSASAISSTTARTGTPGTGTPGPGWLLSPAKVSRRQVNRQEPKAYILTRGGEAPIRLLIRCVGDSNERVMVRVGGGWADLGEYLKEYVTHHGRKSKGDSQVEVMGLASPQPPLSNPRASSTAGSSPPSRPLSVIESPRTPLHIRKTRASLGEESSSRMTPRTPMGRSLGSAESTPSSDSARSDTQRMRYEGDPSALGLSGPKAKTVEVSEESLAWIESVKDKVRNASGERRIPLASIPDGGQKAGKDKFGVMGRVGATKRLFKKG